MPQPVDRRPRVLILSQYYEPAVGGGTIIDAAGAVRVSAAVADVRVLAGDRDLDATDRLDVPVGGWHAHPGHGPAGVMVRYVPFGRGTLRQVAAAVREVRPDVVLIFSTWSTASLAALALARVRVIPRSTRVVLAPAGELFPGALRQRAAKKKVFLAVGRAVGLWRGISWRASDSGEAETIEAMFPGAEVGIAPVLPAATWAAVDSEQREPGAGVRLVSVGTVGVKKGLDILLGHVAAAGRAGIAVHLDVFGAEIDPAFSARVRSLVADLPEGCSATLHGLQGHDVIAASLARADAFALATQGENYGVAVLEALDAGTPVLLSDTTPWRDLRSDGSGWDLPLGATDRWVEALKALDEADAATRDGWSAAARARARRARDEAESDGARAWLRLLGLPDPPAERETGADGS